MITQLPAHPFLAGMSDKHLEILTKCSMTAHFEPGQLIFAEGEPANRFYLLLSGAVSLEAMGAERPFRVQTIHGGDLLGWSWLFPPYYWHFDAIALEPTDAIFFYGTRLREECERDHDFGYELIKRISKVLITRLQVTRQKWIEEKEATAPEPARHMDTLIT